MYLSGQFQRAADYICRKNLQENKTFRYLAAKCLTSVRKWEDALNMLEDTESTNKTINSILGVSICSKMEESSDNLPLENTASSTALLKGQIYESLDNRVQALDWYKQALMLDVHNYQAFELLVKHQMLTSKEEKDLLEALPFKSQCTEEEADVVKGLYETVLKKYDKPTDSSLPEFLLPLKSNRDVLTNQAERLYYNCGFQNCYKLTSSILEDDPWHISCLQLHIATLVELQKSNDLYYLAHKLVDNQPDMAISWYAVGCYYYLVKKYEASRKFLSKSTITDKLFGPAWLAFGHAFAAEGEHDQASAAYFTSARFMKGCHLPLLYSGLEYGLMKNFKLAEKLLEEALIIAPSDPFVLHEMGVINFHNGDLEAANKYLTEALAAIQEHCIGPIAEKWEPLLNNLGHVHRKLKKYEEALDFHRQALILHPRNQSTLSAMGYCYVLLGNFGQAIEYFHKALGSGGNDTFTSTVLSHTLELFIGESSPCEGLQENQLDLDAVVKEEVVATEKSTTSSLDIEVDMYDND
ncbi:cell division cycle protein 16 homolog isoform X2 [Apostichopus japonicus]